MLAKEGDVANYQFWDRLSAEVGTELHSRIATLYRDKDGWVVEQPQICWLYNRSNSQPWEIKDILYGTPDMWRIKKGCLEIVDHKTKNPSKNGKHAADSWHLTQGSLYALQICENKDLWRKLHSIKVSIWIWHRLETIEDSIAAGVRQKFTYELNVNDLEAVKKWLLKKINRHIAPFSAGYVNA